MAMNLKPLTKSLSWIRINLFIVAGIFIAVYILNTTKDVGAGLKVNTVEAMWVAFFAGLWTKKAFKG